MGVTQVAKELGINDGDEAHEWLYDQRKPRPREVGLQVGGYGVEIRVETLGYISQEKVR